MRPINLHALPSPRAKYIGSRHGYVAGGISRKGFILVADRALCFADSPGYFRYRRRRVQLKQSTHARNPASYAEFVTTDVSLVLGIQRCKLLIFFKFLNNKIAVENLQQVRSLPL